MPANSPKLLPILPKALEDLSIATPCKAAWSDMTQLTAGDERIRFCGQCEKNVYNVVAMTRVEADQLIREKEGDLCIRLHKRADGTVITSDCPVGLEKERLRHRLWAQVAKATASLGLILGLLTGKARADASLRDGDKPAVKKIPTPPVMVTAGAPYVAPKPPKQPEPKPPKGKGPEKPPHSEPVMGKEG